MKAQHADMQNVRCTFGEVSVFVNIMIHTKIIYCLPNILILSIFCLPVFRILGAGAEIGAEKGAEAEIEAGTRAGRGAEMGAGK